MDFLFAQTSSFGHNKVWLPEYMCHTILVLFGISIGALYNSAQRPNLSNYSFLYYLAQTIKKAKTVNVWSNLL